MSKCTEKHVTKKHLTIDKSSRGGPGVATAIIAVASIFVVTARADLLHATYTYDWSTATVGQTLKDGNDGWIGSGSGHKEAVVKTTATAPVTGFTGNYCDFLGEGYSSGFCRTNDATFSYSIHPSIKHMSISAVLQATSLNYEYMWLGLRDGGNDQLWRFGKQNAYWCFRDRSGTLVSLGNGSGEGQITSSRKSFKMTFLMDLENNTLDLLVDNLATSAGPETIASGVSIGTFGDPSAFDGLYVYGQFAKTSDDITLMVPEPASLWLVAFGGLALFRRRGPKEI